MSKYDQGRAPARRAVALSYGAGDAAPVIVASGMGYLAEKIVETAAESGVPVYEDSSLATILTQLQLGQEIPEELYQAIVEIYVYFLRFDPQAHQKAAGPGREAQAETAPAAQKERQAETAQADTPPTGGPEAEGGAG